MGFLLKICLFLCAVAVQAKTVTFTILSFNDVYEIVPDALGRGGFAEMQALLQQERAKSQFHITTVNGDFLSPSILSVFDKGAHRIDLFNMLGVDIVALGNHEFDFGPDEVKKRIKESHFPWLAANAIGLDGRPFTGENQKLILDVDGIKIGIFGLITTETPDLSATEQKVCFSPLVYTAKKVIQELKAEGAEVIVALTHLLISEDLQLAEEVPEIDVILGGHDHDPITWYNDRTFVHKSGQNADYLARIDLILEKKSPHDKVIVLPSWNIILNKGMQRDPIVGAKVDELQALLDTITAEPIAMMDMECDSLYSNVRTRETKMGNLVADSLRYSFEADVAFITGGVIRGNRFYQPGKMLTLRDLMTEFPFGNVNVVVEVEGRALLEALENGVSQVEGKAGRFPQVSGLQFLYDTKEPAGHRIKKVFVQGQPLDLQKNYKVATVDYIYNGGDGYNMFKAGKVLVSPLKQIDMVSTFADYIKKLSRVSVGLEGRISLDENIPKLDDGFGL